MSCLGQDSGLNAFILMDLESTHNLISRELAQKLGIKTEEMGCTTNASGPFEGPDTIVTPLIGKLQIHVQDYVDQEEFYVSPLVHQDVILGVPWFHRKFALLKFLARIITFSHKGKELDIKVNEKGKTIPIVNHVQIQKSIKSIVCAYLIFAKDVSNEHEHLTSNIASDAQKEQETIPI